MKKYRMILIGLLLSVSFNGVIHAEDQGGVFTEHGMRLVDLLEFAMTDAAAAEDGYTLAELRGVAEEQEAAYSVAYLGYYGGEYEDLAEYLEECGLSGQYPLLLEIPEERYIYNEGAELYCIVPTDENASLQVNTWGFADENDWEGQAGDILYQSETGEPILVTGNVSDIFPNLLIQITDPEGTSYQYQPFMSLMDNTLAYPEEGMLLDFTPYENEVLFWYEDEDWDTDYDEDGRIRGENPSEIAGDWTADGVSSVDGALYSGTLTFHANGTLEFCYGQEGGDYENYYTGSWYYYDTAEEGQSYDGTVGFALNLSQSSGSGAADIIGGEYLILRIDDDLIELALLEGDMLFPDQYWSQISLTRAVS